MGNDMLVGCAFSDLSPIIKTGVLSPALLPTVVILYRLFLHPLSRVPGPRLAAISNVWHAYYARNGRMLELGKTLHKKYGPAVRVGPNEVWFDSVEAFKAIYGANNGFEKSNFYLPTLFGTGRVNLRLNVKDIDTLDLLSETNMTRYRLQRRLVGPVYHASNVRKWEATIDKVLQGVVAQLKTLNAAEVDLKEWMHIIVVECLGAVVLSWSPGFLRAKTDFGSGSHSYIAWRRRVVFGLFPLAEAAQNYFPSLGRLFSNLWRVTYKPPKNFKTFFPGVNQQIKKRVNRILHEGAKPTVEKKDLLTDLITLHRKKPEFSETYLRRMATTNFGAGHETMTSALTSALAMIGTHRDVERKVIDELQRAGDDEDAVTPYIIACIKESQRLYPVIGMSLSRTVPASGLHVHGQYVPPGSTVGCNPIALHRNPGICGEEPDSFKPERWLGEPGATRSMERYNLSWGGGARTCPGRYLAEMIVERVVSTLLREFHLEITMPPEEEFRFYYVAMMTGVKVRFLSRQVAESP